MLQTLQHKSYYLIVQTPNRKISHQQPLGLKFTATKRLKALEKVLATTVHMLGTHRKLKVPPVLMIGDYGGKN